MPQMNRPGEARTTVGRRTNPPTQHPRCSDLCWRIGRERWNSLRKDVLAQMPQWSAENAAVVNRDSLNKDEECNTSNANCSERVKRTKKAIVKPRLPVRCALLQSPPRKRYKNVSTLSSIQVAGTLGAPRVAQETPLKTQHRCYRLKLDAKNKGTRRQSHGDGDGFSPESSDIRRNGLHKPLQLSSGLECDGINRQRSSPPDPVSNTTELLERPSDGDVVCTVPREVLILCNEKDEFFQAIFRWLCFSRRRYLERVTQGNLLPAAARFLRHMMGN